MASVTLSKLVGLSLVAAFVLTSLIAQPGAADEGTQVSDGYLPDEVVVKLVPGASVAEVAVDYGLDPTPIDQFGSRPIYRLRITDGATPPERSEELVKDPNGRVMYAEPNYVGQTPEGRQQSSWSRVDDGDFSGLADQWAVDKIRLQQAHALTQGAGVTVAVLDTGVDATHPALAGHLIKGYDFVDMDLDPSEEGAAGKSLSYGHGTHVAGLVALAAPEASIMPVRVLDSDGIGNVWVLAEALSYAANPDGDPATDDGADVINLSLSTTRKTSLLDEIVGSVACEYEEDGGETTGDCLGTAQAGAVVVAAAGNSASSTPEYPAAEGVKSLLSVAATTSADGLADFSNYGSWVNVAAPGEQITSAVPGGEYATWSGTSMAAPLTAGEVALVRSAYQGLSSVETVDRVLASAANIGGPEPFRIDAAAAVGARE